MLDSLVLRSRAETRLRTTRSQLRAMPQKDVEDLVHELQVHQIELQMQNEELRRLQEELAASRQKYCDLYEFAPLGYLTLTREGVIADVNFLGGLWLGQPRTQLKGRKFASFVKPAFQDAFYIHYRRAFESSARQSCEVELVGKGLFVQLNSQLHIPADGYCCTTMTDVTRLVEANRPA